MDSETRPQVGVGSAPLPDTVESLSSKAVAAETDDLEWLRRWYPDAKGIPRSRLARPSMVRRVEPLRYPTRSRRFRQVLKSLRGEQREAIVLSGPTVAAMKKPIGVCLLR